MLLAGCGNKDDTENAAPPATPPSPAQAQAAADASAAPTVTPAPPPGSDAESYVKFGQTNKEKGDLDGAIAAFNQAIKINPQYASAYFNRATVYEIMGRLDLAMADYDKAIQTDPHYAEAYYRRGALKGQSGDFDGAIADFSAAIQLDPKYAAAYFNRGHALYFKGDLDGAQTELTQALSLDPNFSLSYFIRGLIRHAQGERPEAISDFQKSAGLGFPTASLWLWITEMENGQQGLARNDLSVALGQPALFKPDDWSAQLGNFLLGQLSQDQLLAKAKEGPPDEAPLRLCEAWFYIGMSKYLSGDKQGAQDAFSKAMATGEKGAEEFVEANRELTAMQNP